jgi:hypothetical protein
LGESPMSIETLKDIGGETLGRLRSTGLERNRPNICPAEKH